MARTRAAKGAKKQEPATSRRYLWWTLFLFAISFAAYANTLGHGFVFDDAPLISQSPTIRGLHWSQILSLESYRPVRTLTYALNYALGGDKPFGYHLFNVILHAINAVLVFLLFRRWGLRTRIAALAGIFFGVHPVQTAAVAYVSGRKDILAATFILLGFHAYTSYRRNGRKVGLFLSLCLFVLAILSKEVAVVFPALVLLVDMFVLNGPEREDPERGRVLARLWHAIRTAPVFYGLSGILLFLGAYYAIFVLQASRMNGFWGGNPVAHYATSFRLFVHYVRLVLVPHPLIADYTGQVFRVSKGFLDPASLAAIVVLAGFVYLAAKMIVRNPRVTVGMLWFLVSLLPVLQIIPFHELAADHFLYVPLIGVVLILAETVDFLGRIWNERVVWIATAVVLIVSMAVTIDRNRDWKDAFTLWSATYETAPGSSRANQNLGMFYSQRGDQERAIRHTRRSIELDPSREQAWSNLGALYRVEGSQAREAGDLNKAEALHREGLKYLKRAIQMEPRDVWAFANLGQLYRDLGLIMEARGDVRKALEMRVEAVKQFQKAIAVGSDNPYFPRVWLEMGKVFMDAGYYDQALDYLKHAGEAFPTEPELLYNMALCHFNLRHYREAIPFLDGLVQLPAGRDRSVWGMLARCYEETGNNAAAIRTYERALVQEPASVELHYNLGVLYHRVGDTKTAVRHLERALQLDPAGPLAGNVRQMLEAIKDDVPQP